MRTKRNWKMKGFRGRRQIPFAPNSHPSEHIGRVVIAAGWTGPNAWTDAERSPLRREITVYAAADWKPGEVRDGGAQHLRTRKIRAWTWRGLEAKTKREFAR